MVSLRESLGLPPPVAPAEDRIAADVPDLDNQTLKSALVEMIRMRRIEEDAAKAYGRGKISGFCHLYIGQEAVAEGTVLAMRPDDYMISAYREHAQALAKGMDAKGIMAELFGKRTGSVKGKGGSMHLFDNKVHFLGGHGIVGGQIPIAAGVGFAIRYNEEDRVIVCFFGDAAINQGAFYEAANMAVVWKLPVIFICENNLYGMGTAIRRTSATDTLAQRADGLAMPSMRIDGQHVFRMYEGVFRAIQRARAGEGPTLIEALCYRYRGHSMSDPQKYRTREEVEQAKEYDPIGILQAILFARGVMTEADVDAIELQVRAEMDEVTHFADTSELPPTEWAFEDVLVADEVSHA